ncbi:hypothetical protein HDV01_001375, partial [Terramyces sp. JEL0728]
MTLFVMLNKISADHLTSYLTASPPYTEGNTSQACCTTKHCPHSATGLAQAVGVELVVVVLVAAVVVEVAVLVVVAAAVVVAIVVVPAIVVVTLLLVDVVGTFWQLPHHTLRETQVKPGAQQVEPVYPFPEHCPHSATGLAQAVGVELVVVVLVAAVVPAEEVVGGCAELVVEVAALVVVIGLAEVVATTWQDPHHTVRETQVNPAAQQVEPVYPIPEHCPHSATGLAQVGAAATVCKRVAMNSDA